MTYNQLQPSSKIGKCVVCRKELPGAIVGTGSDNPEFLCDKHLDDLAEIRADIY